MAACCSVVEAQARKKQGALMLDVREFPEYAEAHVEGSQLLPLGELRADPARVQPAGEVLLLCRSGRRAREAAQVLEQAGCSRAVVVEGGIDAWKQAGLPVRGERGPISLERQVRIAAGSLVLAGLALDFVLPGARFLAAFIGAGLVFAGVTDTCGMGLLLAKLPWNRRRTAPACASR